jgi:hypothetical protein
MSEHRSVQRTNVSWRAAIQIAIGQIVPAKVINFSTGGLKLQCANLLKDGQTYQMMMEVPDPRDASLRTQVTCKATCSYSTLSDSVYRAGMKYFEIPAQHQALVDSWCGIVPAKVAKQTGSASSEELTAVL